MRFLQRSILLFIITLSICSFGHSVDEIMGAISKGDATGISRHFDQIVEMTVSEKSYSYSRTQAQMVLKEFFSNRQVRQFRMMHKANSDDAEYYVGLLSTSRGDFRTTVRVRYRSGKRLIQELRFE
jgi:hypothetical protein